MRRSSRAATIMLRGANDYMLDEMDRSLHDSLCVVKRVLESGSVVPGGCMPPGGTSPGCCLKMHLPAGASWAAACRCSDAMHAWCKLFASSAGVWVWLQALLQAKHSAAMRCKAVGSSTTALPVTWPDDPFTLS